MCTGTVSRGICQVPAKRSGSFVAGAVPVWRDTESSRRPPHVLAASVRNDGAQRAPARGSTDRATAERSFSVVSDGRGRVQTGGRHGRHGGRQRMALCHTLPPGTCPGPAVLTARGSPGHRPSGAQAGQPEPRRTRVDVHDQRRRQPRVPPRSRDTLVRVSACDRPSTTADGRTAYSTSTLATIYLVHEIRPSTARGGQHHLCQPGLRTRHRACSRPVRLTLASTSPTSASVRARRDA